MKRVEQLVRYTPNLRTRDRVARHWMPLLLWALNPSSTTQVGVNPSMFN